MIDLTQEKRALLRLRVEQTLYEVESGNQIPSAGQGMLTAVQSNRSETTLTELHQSTPRISAISTSTLNMKRVFFVFIVCFDWLQSYMLWAPWCNISILCCHGKYTSIISTVLQLLLLFTSQDFTMLRNRTIYTDSRDHLVCMPTQWATALWNAHWVGTHTE